MEPIAAHKNVSHGRFAFAVQFNGPTGFAFAAYGRDTRHLTLVRPPRVGIAECESHNYLPCMFRVSDSAKSKPLRSDDWGWLVRFLNQQSAVRIRVANLSSGPGHEFYGSRKDPL